VERGRRYVFHLRDDVHWSDEVPVTAEDFEYAWKRVLDPATGAQYPELLYDVRGAAAYHQGEAPDPETIGVCALDDTTLLVDLEGPTGYFPQLLTCEATFPVPRHVVERHGATWAMPANIVTNGPFALVEWRRDESLVLVRSRHHGGAGGGNVERVEVALIERGTWREQAALYEADELDVMYSSSLRAEQRDQLRRRYADQFISISQLVTIYVGFHVDRLPFDNARVRRALTLATDREFLAGITLGGYDLPATGGFVPPGMPGHSPGIGLPYDPEQARRLMAKVGYPGGRGFPALRGFMPTRSSRMIALAEYLRAQWQRELGVEVDWEHVPASEFWDKAQWDQHHLHLIGWLADYPDPDNFLRLGFGGERTAWRSEKYDRLVARARRLLNQGERMSLYRRADRILIEEAPCLPLAYLQSHMLVKPWVKGPTLSASGYWSWWKDAIIEPH
jgi:oligopeptide transport system substrate-binding protein